MNANTLKVATPARRVINAMKVVALPSGQGLLCIHSCVSAPEDRWISRPASTLSAHLLTPFLSLPVVTREMLSENRRVTILKKCRHLYYTHRLLLRLLLWWWCLVLEPERDLAFFFLSRLRDRDRRLSLPLLWCCLKIKAITRYLRNYIQILFKVKL